MRKHAKDSWNGCENDNLDWNDLQMYFKVIKSGTNRKLVYDFPLDVYSNFCRITHRHFQLPQSHLTPPLQRTPTNICINLILPETTFPGLHFCPWQHMGSSANFRTVLSESRRRQHISCRARNILTQNGHSRSFNVIYFGIIEEPLMGYIAQYNKCGLRCEGSEDIASERSENLHFRPPHHHLTPLSSEPPRIFT